MSMCMSSGSINNNHAKNALLTNALWGQSPKKVANRKYQTMVEFLQMVFFYNEGNQISVIFLSVAVSVSVYRWQKWDGPTVNAEDLVMRPTATATSLFSVEVYLHTRIHTWPYIHELTYVCTYVQIRVCWFLYEYVETYARIIASCFGLWQPVRWKQ